MPNLPPSTAWSRFGLIFLGVGFVLILGMLWLAGHLRVPGKANKPTAVATPAAGRALAIPSPGVREPAVKVTPAAADQAKKAAADTEKVAQLTKAIGDALAALRDPAVKDKTAALKVLRDALKTADPAVAIAAIRQFLAGKEDAVTGLGFKVGQNGVLTNAPTLRTFLMDQLGTISAQAGTNDAAEAARETLATKTSPDEWAVAMRNVAWADPQGSKAFLAEKARELISYTPWQQMRSGGYLEAFDVAAYSGDPSLFDVLAPLARDGSPLQQAALVAMDRLSALSPDQVASYLNAHPDILADRPMVRADDMGKVDLSDADQRSQAEAYLQRADVSMDEKAKFLSRLGLPAAFESNNLLTPPQAQTINVIAHRELVNQTATVWLNSGQFPSLQAPLQRLIATTQPGG